MGRGWWRVETRRPRGTQEITTTVSAKSAPETIGLHEAADRRGVHYMTIYRYIRTGRLPAVKRGGEWRVDPGDLDRLGRHEPSPGARARRRGWATDRILDRLLAGDELGAWNVVESALASGAEPAEIHLELLAPALRTVGERWSAGDLDVGEEHRASVVARRLVGRLGPRFRRRGRKRATVVLGAVAGERHEIPVAIVADLLRAAGFEVTDLGADTPAASFVTAAVKLAPAAVLISVTGSGHEETVAATVAALRRATTCPVLVGGAAVPDRAKAISLGSDDWTGSDARDVVAVVEQLTTRGEAAQAAAAGARAGTARVRPRAPAKGATPASRARPARR